MEQADSYLAFLLTKGTKEYRDTPGNVSVKVWSNKQNDCCHFWTVTEWDSWDAVKRFAGADIDKAVYYPEDEGVLLEFEESVSHYQCYDVSAGRVRKYILQLQQLYAGGSWQGESFVSKFEGVDELAAFSQPVPGVHSIAEIVWHCIYWRMVLINRMQGNHSYREETVQTQNFLPTTELKEKGWEALRSEFDQSQASLIALLGVKNDSFLEEEYQSGFTYGHHIEGIVQHDIYHLGQIGLVKKMLGM